MARDELDLCVDFTKLALNLANCCVGVESVYSHRSSSVTSGRWRKSFCTARGCAHPSQPAGVGSPPLPARAPPRPIRALVARVSGAPASSAIHVPVCTPHMRTARPSRAAVARESTGWRIHPSQGLLLPSRRREAEPLPLNPSCLCVDTHNACRTGHVFLTLPPLISHTKAGGRRARHRVRLADAHHSSSRNAKAAVIGWKEGPGPADTSVTVVSNVCSDARRCQSCTGKNERPRFEAAKERASVATAAYDALTGPAIRFRPEPATHQRAKAREARSFTANGLPLRGQPFLLTHSVPRLTADG